MLLIRVIGGGEISSVLINENQVAMVEISQQGHRITMTTGHVFYTDHPVDAFTELFNRKLS